MVTLLTLCSKLSAVSAPDNTPASSRLRTFTRKDSFSNANFAPEHVRPLGSVYVRVRVHVAAVFFGLLVRDIACI